MKKRLSDKAPSRLQNNSRATISKSVTANDVVANLLELFEHLGLSCSRSVSSLDDLRRSNIFQHPLYPYAPAIGEMLTSWHQDPLYLDEKGNPLAISMRGKTASFHRLAHRHVPDLDESFLLAELVRLGIASVDKCNFVRVHTRSFPAYENKELAIQHTLTSLNGFISTLRHNLDSAPSNSAQLFHRITQCNEFDYREIPALKIRVKRLGQNFLESFDDWLLRKAIPGQKSGKGRAKVSIGIYLSVDNQHSRRAQS